MDWIVENWKKSLQNTLEKNSPLIRNNGTNTKEGKSVLCSLKRKGIFVS